MHKREILALLQKFNAKNDNLAKYTTFGIGGKAIVAFPKSQEELTFCLSILKRNNLDFKIIGCGSNLLAPSRKINLIIVCTKEMSFDIKQEGNIVSVSSGVSLGQFIMWCANNGLSGLENLYGIPATIGGAVVMNAGAFNVSIFDKLQSVKIFENGKTLSILARDIKIDYHWTELLNSGKVVLEANFKLENDSQENIFSRLKEIAQKRSEKQPTGKSAGSVFKNPKLAPAGKLIDDAGLKGKRIGNALISTKHANFIISEGASDKQVKKLINLAQKKVYKKYGIKLEREIEYIGEKDENHGRLSYSYKV